MPGMMDIDGRTDELPRLRLQDAIGSESLALSTGASAPTIVHNTGSPIVSELHTVQPIPRELRALCRDMAPIDDALTSEP